MGNGQERFHGWGSIDVTHEDAGINRQRARKESSESEHRESIG